MPEISVVIPIYNVEPYLNRCVDSIINQTYSNFQLILVDDGSPDNCGKICDEYAKKDSRIHVIHRENGGLSAARNNGIDWVFDNSFTKWITFIDSDDWVTPNYLEKLIQTAKDFKVDIVIGNSQHVHDGESEKDSGYGCINEFFPEELWVKNKDLSVVAWGKLYKTKLFEKIKYPEGKIHEDEFTTYQLLFSQKKVAVNSAKIYVYFFSSSSIMRSEWTPKKLDSLEAFQEQLLFFKKNKYRQAYKESKKQYMFSITHNLNEIEKSKNKKQNYKLMKKRIQKYLYSRYHNKLLSSMLFCGFYIKKIRIELFFTVRLKAIKNKVTS